jgi:NTE family protein
VLHQSIPEVHEEVSEVRTVQELAFTVDSLDTVAFPTRGTLFSELAAPDAFQG